MWKAEDVFLCANSRFGRLTLSVPHVFKKQLLEEELFVTLFNLGVKRFLRCLSEVHRFLTSGCASVPPTLHGSGDVRTFTVPVNGHLTLECLADSDPTPDIEWYKDEAKLQVRSQNPKHLLNPEVISSNSHISQPASCYISLVVESSDWLGVSTWRYRRSDLRTAATTAVWSPTSLEAPVCFSQWRFSVSQ